MRDKTIKQLVAGVVVVLAIVLVVAFCSEPKGGSSDSEAVGKSSDYSLQFSPEFRPGQASRDDLGVSVVLAVDVSGSMFDIPLTGGPQKYIQASQALVRVVDVLERLVANSPSVQVIRLGIVKFDDDVVPLLPLTSLDVATLRKVRSLVSDPNNFAPGNTTAIGAALELGAEWLAQSGTILRSLIVVTDGINTAGQDPERVLAAIYANRNSAATADFPVYTNTTLISLIGFDIDQGQFSALEALGARVTSAADEQQLSVVLSNLLEADITRLEAAALGD
ncbi:MAG: hypothetical protein A2087_02225 [Spirochaetes bacterium GWD1_61_31]|nr:MAG: hypothetical protein A2Y37_00645 [Spirochaetes bacterium GWB1_60_80]OHD29468.1 MAG: hypothetical protein A2004_03690 [Spirochaetes bacterium GWC1_61_12]OHD43988.1 MAG: hypothetical protein A2087_02225 [Spirochaetes bacterium GWD1_61_31]OHD46200.1 MAG: hypothetical protein A2Y35_00880 [Spirochaetes bacterium GWE1_60_18]OHD60738.1 MAG: hypothetical protein A2Y32_07685 [Spirochaetes bacterium GWF1_60_12]HAP43869.1 hypothetical protein [Spirochaetaceae bacterium]